MKDYFLTPVAARQLAPWLVYLSSSSLALAGSDVGVLHFRYTILFLTMWYNTDYMFLTDTFTSMSESYFGDLSV